MLQQTFFVLYLMLVVLMFLYAIQVVGMAWRVITPSDVLYVDEVILHQLSEPSPGKRRKSSGRKKSSKSESEQDAAIPDAVKEDLDEKG